MAQGSWSSYGKQHWLLEFELQSRTSSIRHHGSWLSIIILTLFQFTRFISGVLFPIPSTYWTPREADLQLFQFTRSLCLNKGCWIHLRGFLHFLSQIWTEYFEWALSSNHVMINKNCSNLRSHFLVNHHLEEFKFIRLAQCIMLGGWRKLFIRWRFFCFVINLHWVNRSLQRYSMYVFLWLKLKLASKRRLHRNAKYRSTLPQKIMRAWKCKWNDFFTVTKKFMNHSGALLWKQLHLLPSMKGVFRIQGRMAEALLGTEN